MTKRRQLLAATVAAAFASSAAAQDKPGDQMQQGAQNNPAQQNSGQAQNQTQIQKQKQKQDPQKQDRQQAMAPGAPVVVLVPVAIAQAGDFGDGCWARLYDGQNFRGNELALLGPVDMANMRTAFGTDWSGQFDSVMTGPKATVTVYDNENYRQKAATIRPNQKIADLD
ncbi:MAG TPA: beta/gamma crystallin domain-containing protein, partial [Burkholderiales bacterium]|nr:beta/gamma crystallin domain-containing protein [Burkholderiales bacterium]